MFVYICPGRQAAELGNQLGALCSVQMCCLVVDVNENTFFRSKLQASSFIRREGFQTDNFFPRRSVDVAGHRDSE